MDPSTPNAQPAPTVVIQQKESLFGRFGKLLLIALGVCVLALMGMSAAYQQYFGDGTGPTEKYHSLSREATKKIAIVKVSGAIMEGDDFIERQLDQVEKDSSVVGVVLRIDSPGGTVTYSHRLYHQARELLKQREMPMVVSMGSLCASGGYYLAMAVGDQEDVIYAEPTTWTGSIGVVIPLYGATGLMFRLGVTDRSIASGDLKLMGSPTSKMGEEERAVLQTLVDESFERFRSIVVAGRPKLEGDEETLTAATTGQIFTADQAKELGLVDRIGFIEDAVERAAELAGVSTNEVRTVQYEKRMTPIEQFLNASGGIKRPPSANTPDLKELIELATPRAYYLSTLAPILIGSHGQ